jgi:geranylgeranyl transferase type-2 subunit alpha
MHGIRRDRPALTSSQLQSLTKYCSACHLLLSSMKIVRTSPDAEKGKEILSLSAKLIDLNPDFYSLWNFRREILIQQKTTQQLQEETMKSAMETELAVSTRGLNKNPKCYCAWHHRRWCIEFSELVDINKEISLCQDFLNLDSRNFHCWNYRKFLINKTKENNKENQIKSELEFTRSMIEKDFSNYSAWHFRSSSLEEVCKLWFLDERINEEKLLFLQAELQLVKQALYTDPNDQSLWLYHRWILRACESSSALTQLTSNSTAPLGFIDFSLVPSNFLTSIESLFTQEIQMCKELESLEEKCKWPLIAKLFLLTNMENLRKIKEKQKYQKDEERERKKEINETVERLMTIDPIRTPFYQTISRREDQ